MELQKIKGFLVDMDGTTFLSDKLLPGAKDFFDYLNEKQIKYLFFTNNPSESVNDYVGKLTVLGLEKVTANSIITSGQATISYLNENNIKSVFLLGTPSYASEVTDADITLTENNPQAVVLSFDKTLTYEKLEKATYLINNGAKYIATNPDLVCPTENGPIPDCGAIAALLEKSTGRKPLYIGKPHRGMVEAAAKRLGVGLTDMAIVGDRLYTDMKMAMDHKMTSILVLSGETKKQDMKESDLFVDYVVDDLKSLLKKLK